ncbi:ABC transporter substrate-binding protein [Breoghania sp.]|uniref:ABC transporter substrate-binding protein n=1 Tax=Breoghania sp. TaxID=2065378 RepID=UPI002626D17A|nr:ABC transporter substrate-binding protein [Breoghania sp.]MDJ0933250.1 ABC transporter substrate-binding protein [Breoghania sp.]
MVEVVPKDQEKKKASRTRRRLLLGLPLLIVAGGLFVFAPAMERIFAGLFGKQDDNYSLIAVYADDREESSFLHGVELAVEHINASPEKVLGKELDLGLVCEDKITSKTELETTVAKTLKLSDGIAHSRNLVAVVGHEKSDTAITASSVYARNNVLFMATHATATSLTNHSFETVFALRPDNELNANLIGTYALKHGYSRFIILSDKSDYGKESSNFFTETITRAGATVVFRSYLSGTSRSIDDLLMFILDNKLFKRTDFDAFFVVSSSLSETAEFIKRARNLGLDVPVFGMEYMFSDVIEKTVGKEGMRDVFGVSFYDRDSTVSERAKAFIQQYGDAFGGLPDRNAVLGYDSTMLVRDAVNRARTIDADRVSDTLKIARYKRPFVGVTCPLVFDRNGLITDTEIYIVRHDGTAFHTVSAIKIPLERNFGSGSYSRKVEGSDPAAPSAVQAGADYGEHSLDMERNGQ